TSKYQSNIILSNAADANPIIANQLTTNSIASTSNSFSFTVPFTPNALGTLTYSANGLDSATTKVNVLITNTITINSNPYFQHAAINVIGQGSFTTNTAALTRNGLNHPQHIDVNNSGVLFVADGGNNRVLSYNSPFTDNMGAAYVLGQSSFTSNTVPKPLTQSSLLHPNAVKFDDSTGNLWVADTGNNRVLMFLPANQVIGGAASIVLGQPTFAGNTASLTQNGFNNPSGLTFDNNGNLWISDSGNNRVLEYLAANLVQGGKASLVIGQPSFTTNTAPLTQNGLRFPTSATVDNGGNLYIADFNNNRVLQYSAANLVMGGTASVVLGQNSFTTNVASLSQSGINHPEAVSIGPSNNLWVGDNGNNRVLEFTSPFLINGLATLVIGQNTFDTNTVTLSQNSLQDAEGLNRYTLGGVGYIAISDSGDNRIVTYPAAGGGIIISDSTPIQGQTIVLTGTVTGGSSPYTYNYYITNTTNGNLIANILVTNALSTNTFTFTLPSTADSSGYLLAQLTASDGADTPITISTANTIQVNTPVQVTIAPSSATLLDAGQSVT
ncbi:MAG: NHL repeat-containing protein, partial [Patescibacteria group bacterium]|nr:NHL repeat-containing protein [Patescibacteria group bacterium]